MFLLKRKKYRDLLWSVALGAVLFWGVPSFERALRPGSFIAPYDTPRAQMSLHIFDVGQGDAILAQQGDRQILIDGGPDARVLEKLGTTMPAGDRTIELMVLTHPHADHVVGLNEVLERYQVERILTTDVVNDTATYRRWQEALASEGAVIDDASVVREERIGEMVFSVLHAATNESIIGTDRPGNSGGFNDASIVGMLAFGAQRFLLMGDATSQIETQLVEVSLRQNELQADFLKVGHHGSAYSTGEKFIDAVRPTYAAISVGARNTYGHPAWRVIRLLETMGITAFRTDQHGDITATTDGETLQVTTEKVP